MNGQFPFPKIPLVIYTDLDGSLLDHNTYSLEAARPALDRLQQLNVPIIPVTSKTLCEVDHLLNTTLHMRTPVIAENGGVVAVPSGYFPVLKNFRPAEKYVIREVRQDYKTITTVLQELRQKYGFIFYGFNDLCESQVAELTGLRVEEAKRARWRRCSEPVLWRDSHARLGEFKSLIEQQGLSLTQGGRFLHVMGNTDKGRAMQTVDELFRQFGLVNHTALALGDSPNDLPMLQQADVSVAVRRFDGSHLLPINGKPQFQTFKAGPVGWNEFVMKYLDRHLTVANKQRIAHG